jgi:hypothetical protein
MGWAERWISARSDVLLRIISLYFKPPNYQSITSPPRSNPQVINVRWATEDPNPGVKERLKRKAETEVIETIRAALPIIGDKGTILDYDAAHRPVVRATGGAKGTTRYEDDEDAWTAYCREYVDAYGVYPDGSMPVVQSGSVEYAVRDVPVAGQRALVADYASSDDE